MKERILITGGAGFAGHHVVEHILKNTEMDIVVFDKLTYAASGFDRLRDISVFTTERVKVFTVDFTQPIPEGIKREVGALDYILHMGAETHVDKSIEDPYPFLMSNVIGTYQMLEFARKFPALQAFIYFSTDEVFGPAPFSVNYGEWDRYRSGNPYAASKAGGEELALAYHNTYKVPVVITHTMNMFGERQHAEKFIPTCIRKILKGEEIQVHSDPTKTIPGSRFYIHARNVADALLFILRSPDLELGQKFNIVGSQEVNNLRLAIMIGKIMGKNPLYKLVNFHSSRPGHDLRYALSGMKMRAMGWNPPVGLEESLRKVVEWSLKHPYWIGL